MEFQEVGVVKVKAKALSPTVWDLVPVKVCDWEEATGELIQAPGGEVIQSFVGDEKDLEVDVLHLYGEPVNVAKDRSDVFTGAGEQPGS